MNLVRKALSGVSVFSRLMFWLVAVISSFLSWVLTSPALAQSCSLGINYALNGTSTAEIGSDYTAPANVSGCYANEMDCVVGAHWVFGGMYQPPEGEINRPKDGDYASCKVFNSINPGSNKVDGGKWCWHIGVDSGTGAQTVGSLNAAVDVHMKSLTDGCTPAADNGCFKVTRTYTRCSPKAGIPPPPNAIANSPQPAQTCSSPSNPSISGSQAGSQIDCRDRTLRQSIPIVGTDFSLNYSSRETQGAGPVNNSFSVLVSPNDFSPSFGNITTISVTVLILDQTLNQVFTINAPRFNELQANFEWNGKNKAGTLVSGVQKAKVTITYNFQRSYLSNTPIKLTKTRSLMVGQSSNLLRFNLGGWSLSEYHNFDSTTKTVFTGFGPRLLLENPAVTPAYLANAANIINVPSADSTRIYQFSPAGLHLRTLDALTAVAIYSFQHDASNRLISIRDRDGLETLVQRDSGGKALAIVGPYGDKTTLSLDASGYLASITNPQNERTSFSYFAAPKTGLMASYTDPLGSQKSYTFDVKGQLSEAKDFNGGIKKFTTNRSDPGIPLVLGSIFSSPMGRLTQYLSSPGGDGSEKLENIYPDDRSDTIETSADKLHKTIQYRDGHAETFDFTPHPQFGERLSVLSHSIHVAGVGQTVFKSLKYSEQAKLQSAGDPSSLMSYSKSAHYDLLDELGTENFTYTKADQTMTHTSFSGRKLTMNLDSFGRITKSQFGNLAARSYSYDTKGRLIKQTQASRSISYTYDAKGLLASVTDPLGRITKFSYDLARRLKSITLPNAKQILMGYDAKGRDTSVTLPGAQSYSQGFDKKDNLLSLLEPIIAGSSYQWNWQYNLDDDLVKETLPDTSLLNLSYDDFGRLKGITGPNITRTISYDGYGSIGAIKSSSSDQVEFIRYGSWIDSIVWTGKTKGKLGFTPIAPGRLAGISINDQPQISYEYTPEGEVAKANDLVIGRGSITGLISSTNLQSIETKFTYNTFAEPTAYSAKVGTDTLVSFTYTRDALGRIVSMAKTEAGQSSTKTFSYDTIGQLTGETTNGTATGTYSYDANGNRSTPGGGQVYDAHDRLTSDAVWTYTYNRSGYLIKKQHKTNGSYVGYTYDNLGNLLKVDLNGSNSVSYGIDGGNRRINRLVKGAFKSGYLYQDELRPVAEVDAAGNVLAVYVYASRSNVPDLIIKGGVTYRVIADHLGSPLYIVNSLDNTVVQKMSYDTWGRVLSDSNPGFQPFGFAGGIYDTVTGLVRFGARDYDPMIGRWLNKDPIRFEGGWNLYGYVGNDPVNRIDPFGLDYEVCHRPMAGLPDWFVHHRYIKFSNGETISWGPSGNFIGSPGRLHPNDSGGECGPVIPASPRQEGAMKDWAKAHESDIYRAPTQNCLDFSRRAIEAGVGL